MLTGSPSNSHGACTSRVHLVLHVKSIKSLISYEYIYFLLLGWTVMIDLHISICTTTDGHSLITDSQSPSRTSTDLVRPGCDTILFNLLP